MRSTLLFDIGETLLDADAQEDALVEVHRSALNSFGFPITRDEYLRLDREKIASFAPSAMHAITWHFAKPNVDLFDEITQEVRSHYAEIRKLGWKLYPGVAELLRQLAEEYVLALAGNAPAMITDVLGELGVLQWFRFTDVSGSIGIKKPDQRFFKIILEHAGVSPSAAIMIGDRLDNDIIPAKMLGLGTIWVRRGRYGILEPRTPGEIPDATVSEARELYDAITSMKTGDCSGK